MRADLLLEIHPPTGQAPWWWLVGFGLLLAGAGLAWLTSRALSRSAKDDAPAVDDGRARLREASIAELNTLLDGLRAGTLPPRHAAQSTGRLLRRFIGLMDDTVTDFQTADGLWRVAQGRPSLAPVAAIVAELEPLSFAESPADGLAPLIGRSIEVVRTWP